MIKSVTIRVVSWKRTYYHSFRVEGSNGAINDGERVVMAGTYKNNIPEFTLLLKKRLIANSNATNFIEYIVLGYQVHAIFDILKELTLNYPMRRIPGQYQQFVREVIRKK